jgi:hypothetical protein
MAFDLESHVEGVMASAVQLGHQPRQLLSQLRDLSVKLPRTLTGRQALGAAPISRSVSG